MWEGPLISLGDPLEFSLVERRLVFFHPMLIFFSWGCFVDQEDRVCWMGQLGGGSCLSSLLWGEVEGGDGGERRAIEGGEGNNTHPQCNPRAYPQTCLHWRAAHSLSARCHEMLF